MYSTHTIGYLTNENSIAVYKHIKSSVMVLDSKQQCTDSSIHHGSLGLSGI